MGWGSAIGVVGGLFGASQQRRAADAQAKASEAAIAEQRRQYDQMRADQSPFMQYGQGSLGGLNSLMSGDYSGFMNSPDFKARVQLSNEQFNNGAAARYRLFSGGAQSDRDALNQNLAAQGLGDYRGFLQWGANLGQNAAAGVGQAGQASANQIGGYLQNRGDAQASAYGANAGLGYGLAGILGQQPWAQNNMFGSSYGGGYGTGSGGAPFTAWGDY